LTDITDEMRLARQEVFGPLIAVIGYDNIDQAVELANDTDYGLNASVVGPTKLAKKLPDESWLDLSTSTKDSAPQWLLWIPQWVE
jgi:hypothetical protein